MLQPENDYLAFLAQGRFMLLRNRQSGKFMFYPRAVDPLTGSTDLEWAPASGAGTVYSVTIVRKRPPEPSYNVALIDLAEGPRMMSRVDGAPLESIAIGMRVQARVVQEDEQCFVVFEPRQEAAP